MSWGARDWASKGDKVGRKEPSGGDGEPSRPGLTSRVQEAREIRTFLLTLQGTARTSPLTESLAPPDSVVHSPRDSQPRGLSLYPGPDNEGLEVSGFVSPQPGGTSRARPGPRFSTFSGTENKAGPWSPPYSCCPGVQCHSPLASHQRTRSRPEACRSGSSSLSPSTSP